MLPSLKPKAVAGLIISKRKPDGSKVEEHTEGNEDQALHSAADDLIRAIHAKDTVGVASALRAARDLMEPSDDESNDFDSQNEKAALEERE